MAKGKKQVIERMKFVTLLMLLIVQLADTVGCQNEQAQKLVQVDALDLSL